VLKFKNTLSGLIDEFKPLSPPNVHMYCCGPTVYDYAHIGNFRTFMFEDILNRYLRYRGYDVLYVMNITDIDDKTIRNSNAAGLSLLEYTQKYTNAFFEDLDTLRIKRADIICKATEHIDDMVHLVERLRERGFTYDAGGSVYYKISNFKVAIELYQNEPKITGYATYLPSSFQLAKQRLISPITCGP